MNRLGRPMGVAAQSRWRFRPLLLWGGLVLVAVLAVPAWNRLGTSLQLERARRLLRAGETAQARTHLLQMHAAHPRRAEICYWLGVADRRLGEFEEAFQYLQRAEDLGWPLQDVTCQRYMARFEAGDTASTEPYLKQMLTGGATDEVAEQVYEALTRGFLRQFRLNDAAVVLEYWVAWRPNAIQPRLWRAELFREGELWPEAIQEHRKLLELAPDSVTHRLDLADALMHGQRIEDARDEYQEIRRREPGNVFAQVGLAQCERRLGNGSAAAGLLEPVLAMDTDAGTRATALGELGHLALEASRYEQAADYLAAAAALVPMDPQLHHALGIAYSRLGRRDEAQSQLQTSRSIIEKVKQLRAMKQKVLENPTDTATCYQVARLLADVGPAEDAQAWLRMVIRRDPTHAEAKRLLGNLSGAQAAQKAVANRASNHRYAAELRSAIAVQPAQAEGIARSSPSASRTAEGASIEFSEPPPETRVPFVYRNGEETDHCSILESLGGGIGLFDYDLDGALDLCLPGGGLLTEDKQIESLETGLFRNLGGFRFARVDALAGISPTPYYSHGVAAADYDNDGFPDILVTGYGGVLLWTNMGDGTFVNSTQRAAIGTDRWSTSAGWGDFDGDGCLDLYIANYVNWSFENDPVCLTLAKQREVCPPRRFDPLPDYLFYSNGDGTFREATHEAGLRPDGKGLGVVLADLDCDGDLDAYITNDTTENFLYVNDGHGHLTEDATLAGVAYDDAGIMNGSMGTDVFDYNGDGRPDLWVCNYEREAFGLYRNVGQGQFVHVSQSTGITSLGQPFVAFGAACADFDEDGDEDIVVACGHVEKYALRSSRRQPPLFVENTGKRFRRRSFAAETYFGTEHEGRGLAVGDLDNDGDLDLVASRLNAPVAVLRNDHDAGDRVRVRLVGTTSNRNAVGARLTLRTSAGELTRQVKGGGSYLSTSDLRVHWGVPRGAKVESLTVHWPAGQTQVLASVGSNHSLTITEPDHPRAE